MSKRVPADSPTSADSSGRKPKAKPVIKPSTFVKRLVSWIILWILALFFIGSGWKTPSLILIALFGLAGQWEFYHAQQEKGHKVFKFSGLVCGALLYINSWYFLVFAPERADYIHFGQELILVIALLGSFIRLVVVREKHNAPITTAALTMLGLMYVPFLFNYTAMLAFMPGSPVLNRYMLIYLLVVTKFSDVGAYVTGSLFGRHKMIPRISPGKTWEGFAGAILTSLALSVVLAYCLGPRLNQISFVSSIVLGLLLPLVSVVGDLAESVVKRDASIKDSGRTIPGIGGALDLIDSILFTAPVLYFYLAFLSMAGR